MQQFDFAHLPAVFFFTIRCQVILIVAHNDESNPNNKENINPHISLCTAVLLVKKNEKKMLSWKVEKASIRIISSIFQFQP